MNRLVYLTVTVHMTDSNHCEQNETSLYSPEVEEEVVKNSLLLLYLAVFMIGYDTVVSN